MSSLYPDYVEEIIEQVTNKVTENLTEKISETLTETVSGNLKVDVHVSLDTLKIQHIPPPGAFRAVIILKGSKLPGQINVDTTNETATLQFVDRVGEVVPAPEGAVVLWGTDNDGVASVAADDSDPSGATGKVTPNGAGDCNITADVSGAVEADGTPFPQAQVALHVDPGAAAGDRISLSQ